MKRTSKQSIILSAVLFLVCVFSIRHLYTVPLILSFLLLGGIAITRQSRSSTLGLVVSLLLLYPLPSWGWLIGRDTHFAAQLSHRLLTATWPISPGEIQRGFIQTPGIHFSSAILSRITGLPIIPKSSETLLVTAILPIVYLGITVLFGWVLIRDYTNKSWTASAMTAILVIGLWSKLLRFNSAFHRVSLAMAVFAVFTYCLYRGTNQRGWRWIRILSFFVIVVSHHFASVMALGLAIVTKIVDNYAPRVRKTRRSPLSANGIIIFCTLFFMWQFIVSLGGAFVVRNAFSIGQSVSPPTPDSWPIVSRSLYSSYQLKLSGWLYNAILGLPIFAAIVLELKKRERIRRWDAVGLLFGVFVAGFAIISTGAFALNYDRILTYFVVAAGWLAPLKLTNIKTIQWTRKYVSGVFVILLILVAISGVQPHVLGGDVRYEEGIKTEQFDAEMYATAEWINSYNNHQLLGDMNTQEVVTSKTGMWVAMGPRQVLSSNIRAGYHMIHHDRNNRLYFGQTKYGSTNLLTDNLEVNLNRRNSVIYTTNKTSIYR